MWRAVQPRLSAESGFWKTIWMARLSSRRPAASTAAASGVLVELERRRPASGLSMPRIVLASVDLPEPDSPTSPSVSPSRSSRSTPTSAGHVVAALVERLRDVGRRPSATLAADGVRADDRRRLDHLAEPVDDGGSASIAPFADVDDRRHDRPAQLVGQRAAIDEDAGRQVRADLRQVARDRRRAPARTCGRRGAAASAAAPACTDAAGSSKTVAGVALLDDLARRTSRRPGRTASG